MHCSFINRKVPFWKDMKHLYIPKDKPSEYTAPEQIGTFLILFDSRNILARHSRHSSELTDTVYTPDVLYSGPLSESI